MQSSRTYKPRIPKNHEFRPLTRVLRNVDTDRLNLDLISMHLALRNLPKIAYNTISATATLQTNC